MSSERLEHDVSCRDVHHGQAVDEPPHLFGRFHVALTVDKLIEGFRSQKRLDLFGRLASLFPRFVAHREKAAKAFHAAREVRVLVSEAHADSSAEAAEGGPAASGCPALCGSRDEPHDAAPSPFLEPHGLHGFLIGPEQGYGVNLATDGSSDLALHAGRAGRHHSLTALTAP
jgi:hypothetical protein